MTTMPYISVIGLEVHVQLKTESKLFCRCSTQFGQPPNTQVCPVCLGLPGALPVLNRQAVELSIRTGLALNCRIAEFTKWDRKNYFYPDLPKGYQISQFDLPIAADGYLDISDAKDAFEPKRIGIIRAHLEEDAGKSMHDEAAGVVDSRIDLNRTGTPLLEIVSQPDLRSAQEAKAYLTELRLLLLYLGVSDCNMQEGSLRADANVNLHICDPVQHIATPIVEIKNLNSFRAVERAITYEIQRQWQQWQQTGIRIGQAPKQTRGWDDNQGVTTLQREKEESSDYRYFPDPDLVPVRISSAHIESTGLSLGELPAPLRSRLQVEYDLKPYDADVLVSQGKSLVDFFERAVGAGGPAKRVSSWIQQDILRTLKETDSTIDQLSLTPEKLGVLCAAIESGKLDTTRGREVFQWLLENPSRSVDDAIESLGIVAVDQGEIETLCQSLIASNPKVVEEVRAGNVKGLGMLIGQAKKTNPNADPKLVREVCLRMITEAG